MPDIHDATTGHGWTMVDGNLEQLWYEGEVLPQQLADIATDSGEDDTESDDDGSLPDDKCALDSFDTIWVEY